MCAKIMQLLISLKPGLKQERSFVNRYMKRPGYIWKPLKISLIGITTDMLIIQKVWLY